MENVEEREIFPVDCICDFQLLNNCCQNLRKLRESILSP